MTRIELFALEQWLVAELPDCVQVKLWRGLIEPCLEVRLPDNTYVYVSSTTDATISWRAVGGYQYWRMSTRAQFAAMIVKHVDAYPGSLSQPA